jgi:hypothetical protein
MGYGAGTAPALEGKDWHATIEQVIADLDALNRNTEQDFLQIGGKIGGVH